MRNYITLSVLAVLTIVCAVVEGIIEITSPWFIQFNGFLTLVCCLVFLVFWVLSVMDETSKQD